MSTLPKLFTLSFAVACSAVELRLTGPWTITVVEPNAQPVALQIAQPDIVSVEAERYEKFPDFDGKAAPWRKGVRLSGVVAEECTVQGALDPASLVVRMAVKGAPLRQGADYDADLAAGTVGRLPGGTLQVDQTVFVSYRYAKQRIDSIVRTGAGKIELRRGTPDVVLPPIAPLAAGETRVANVFVSGRIDALTEDHVFRVLETAFPEPAPTAAARLPKTLAKLKSGAPLRILAWGDSVSTYGRYQSMFVGRLRQRFPAAQIELVTEAWGGRSTGSYLKEPPGSPHNYREKVLGAKPDLIISEFVNDASLNPAQVDERYGQLLQDFKQAGAEWIILSPHYVRPDWMGLTRQRDIDEDPRPYVKAIRQFAEFKQVALADASARYGRLWRQGIPYLTLMENNINHPNVFGHSIFADSLMALFPAP